MSDVWFGIIVRVLDSAAGRSDQGSVKTVRGLGKNSTHVSKKRRKTRKARYPILAFQRASWVSTSTEATAGAMAWLYDKPPTSYVFLACALLTLPGSDDNGGVQSPDASSRLGRNRYSSQGTRSIVRAPPDSAVR